MAIWLQAHEASTEQQNSSEPIYTAMLQSVLNKISDYVAEQQNQ